jgi:chaperonin GroES
MKLEPRGDSLIVRVIEEEATPDDPFVLPDAANEQPQKGKVLAVGEGKLDDDGTRIPLDLKEGDEVLYSKYGGTQIKIDGEDLLVLHGSDVLDTSHVAHERGQRETEIARPDSEASKRLTELDREIQTNIAELRVLAK